MLVIFGRSIWHTGTARIHVYSQSQKREHIDDIHSGRSGAFSVLDKESVDVL